MVYYIYSNRDTHMRGEIDMTILGNLDFRVTENNGGRIALAIKEDNQFIYIHSDYEGVEWQLIEDIRALFDRQHPSVWHPSVWDGNELSELEEYLEDEEGLEGDDIKGRLDYDYWGNSVGVTVIMDTDSVYISKFLGAAGQEILKNALGFDDVEDFLESHKNSMPMDEFLALCN